MDASVPTPPSGALVFAIGAYMAHRTEEVPHQTQANLLTAMHGEAFAYGKYLAYAAQAART